MAYTYAGVRPLSFEEGRSASKVSREHKVIAEGPGGRFLSVTGTKLTCFRSLAEEIGDRVMQALGRQAPSPTARLSLDGADEDVGMVEARAYMDVSEEMAASGLGREALQVLVDTYGQGYRRVLELAKKLPDGTEPLCPSNPEIVAQLHHAVSDELAVSLQDVLLRRTGHRPEPLPGSRLRRVDRARMAELLGWSARRLDAELDAYRQHVARSQRFRAVIRATVTTALRAGDAQTVPKRPTG